MTRSETYSSISASRPIGIDPSTFDAMVLNNWHYDHFGGMVGFLEKHGRTPKKGIPFFVGGEDAFCIRLNIEGHFGALDHKAILESGLMLMMASEPALVADHAFTTGRIGRCRSRSPCVRPQR